MTFRENFEHSHWRKFIWQYCLQNVGHSACRQCDMNKWELVGHSAVDAESVSISQRHHRFRVYFMVLLWNIYYSYDKSTGDK